MLSRNILRGYMPLLWILVIPVLNIFYGILNHGGTNVSSLATDLDERIPFVPAFIIPYLIWYPFMITMFVVLFNKNRMVYYRTLITLCIGLVACYIIFYFYQTSIERPALTGSGPLYGLVHLIYQTDGPYNCFPSIHVLTSYLMIKATADCVNVSRLSRLLIIVVAWSIIISTVFVRQHVLLDIIGAIILSELLYYTVRKWLRLPAGRSLMDVTTGKN